MVLALTLALALVLSLSLICSRERTTLERDWIMGASRKSQVKGHPPPDLEIVFPDATGLRGSDA